MTARLPTQLVVGALLRRVNDAGGIAMVRARGEAQGGEARAYEHGNFRPDAKGGVQAGLS